MTELRLRAPANLVSPRARWYWAVRALPGWLLALSVEVLVWATASSTIVPAVVVVLTVALAAAHLIVMPQWRYRVHRWENTATAVYTQSGWFKQERRIAPVSRIQTVDTERGPIEQLFGLANVTVTTASAAGPLKIHGLARDMAAGLVDELTVRTQAAGGDGT
ncbi:MAG: PH domain-containing protein [Pseudonocardiales bacterium]|nr:PH domain-containing protein [Actinomycetota bacterium]